MKKKLLLVILFIIISSRLALADDMETINSNFADLRSYMDNSVLGNRLSGELYFTYGEDLNNKANYNYYDVTRAYLTYLQKLDQNVNLRITLDAARISTSLDTNKKAQNLYSFVKIAYFEFPINLHKQISLSARLGLQSTVWIDWVQKIWKHRYAAKVLADNEGILSSADFGASFLGKIVLPALPEIEFQSTILNGAGYKAGENNSGKDVALRLNSDIYTNDLLGTITIGGFANLRNFFNSTNNDTQTGALIALKNDNIGNLYAEVLYGKQTTNFRGYSVGGFAYIIENVSILGRYDQFIMDTSLTNTIYRTIYGFTYDLGKNVKMTLSIQNKNQNTIRDSIMYFSNQVIF